MHSSENMEENSPGILWAGKIPQSPFQNKKRYSSPLLCEGPWREQSPLSEISRRGSLGNKEGKKKSPTTGESSWQLQLVQSERYEAPQEHVSRQAVCCDKAHGGFEARPPLEWPAPHTHLNYKSHHKHCYGKKIDLTLPAHPPPPPPATFLLQTNNKSQ